MTASRLARLKQVRRENRIFRNRLLGSICFNSKIFYDEKKEDIIKYLLKKGYTVEKKGLETNQINRIEINPEDVSGSAIFEKNESEIQGILILYSELPAGNILYKIKECFVSQSTFFKIELNNSNSNLGKFTLVDDEPTLLYAFAMIDGLKDACELHSASGNDIPNIEKIQIIPGIVEFQEIGYWQIKQKIVLKW